MRKLLLLTLAVSLVSVFTPASAKDHVQKISVDSAEAFCSKHGGGHECEFCDPGHCHIINCDKNGGNCTNTVLKAGTKNPGGTSAPDKPVKTSGGSNGTTVKHPVQVGSGINSVVGTNGSNNGSSGGYKGGGMNQSGGYRR